MNSSAKSRWTKIWLAALLITVATAAFGVLTTRSVSGYALLFWVSLALLAYVFVGYPMAVAAWAALQPHPWRRRTFEPSISIVIAVHNEVAHIGRKIANLLELDYPSDRVEILVGSDGSTDGTLDRLRAHSQGHVRVFEFDERRSKPTILNTLVPKARGEIVVLADARQQFDPQVLRALVQSFADPHVGAVGGELILKQNDAGTAVGEGSGFYWRYEKFIRSRESLIDSTIGATGAIYAIRRELFEPIPDDTIGLRPSRSRLRSCIGNHQRRVHAQGAHPDRKLSTVGTRALAYRSNAESALVSDHVPQGSSTAHRSSSSRSPGCQSRLGTRLRFLSIYTLCAGPFLYGRHRRMHSGARREKAARGDFSAHSLFVELGDGRGLHALRYASAKSDLGEGGPVVRSQ